MTDAAAPVAVVELEKDCGYVRKYREALENGEASNMSGPRLDGSEGQGSLYLRYSCLDTMFGIRPKRVRIWVEPLE